MKLYKLTDANAQTYNKTQWGEGITHEGTGEGDLCGPGWIHAYTDPLLAVLLNPIHGDFVNPLLWEAEGEVGKEDHGLKVGCKVLTTIKPIPLPVITTEQKVKFAIYCALEVYRDPIFATWANGWVENKDRSVAAARNAETAGSWAARAAARDAARAARAAAEAAVWAARSWAAAAAEAAAWAEVINLPQIASEAVK